MLSLPLRWRVFIFVFNFYYRISLFVTFFTVLAEINLVKYTNIHAWQDRCMLDCHCSFVLFLISIFTRNQHSFLFSVVRTLGLEFRPVFYTSHIAVDSAEELHHLYAITGQGPISGAWEGKRDIFHSTKFLHRMIIDWSKLKGWFSRLRC